MVLVHGIAASAVAVCARRPLRTAGDAASALPHAGRVWNQTVATRAGDDFGVLRSSIVRVGGGNVLDPRALIQRYNCAIDPSKLRKRKKRIAMLGCIRDGVTLKRAHFLQRMPEETVAQSLFAATANRKKDE